MKHARFDYARPTELGAALDLLAAHGEDAAILAGGQSLMPLLAFRLSAPRLLIDINAISELAAVEFGGGHWRIGALARHADVLDAVCERKPDHLLARALPHVAHLAVRNRGTLGGSLALADPAAELPACMVCLDAEIELASATGRRLIQARDFFLGTYETARRDDEVLVGVRFPAPRPGDRYAFEEVARRKGDYAMAGLAAMIDASGERPRIVAFGAGDRPQRLTAVEALVADRPAARATLATSLSTSDNATNSADYRRRVTASLLDRVLDDLELRA